MFEKFFSNGAGDYRQRYEGTYGFFETDAGRRLLVRLVRVNTETDTPFIDFVDKEGVSYRLNADHDKGFTFLPPKSAWYNVSDSAAYVERTAQRQWTRGLSARNTVIQKLLNGQLTPQRIDFPVLTEIYETDVRGLKITDAMRLKSSFALTPQVALDFAGQKVYVLAAPVGSFKYDGNYTVKVDELWQTEVTDAFRRNGLNAEVKVNG